MHVIPLCQFSPLALLGLCLLTSAAAPTPPTNDLILNANFADHTGLTPSNYTLAGDVEYRTLGDTRRDIAPVGIALVSNRDANRDGQISGSVSQTVSRIDPSRGRWFRFSFRGLPEEGFVASDLYLRIEYFNADGSTSYDHLAKRLYPLVELARKDLEVNGRRKQGGAATWRTYDAQIRIPFPQVGQVKFTVGFTGGITGGKGESRTEGSFLVTDFSLTRIEPPAEKQAPTSRPTESAPPGKLIPLGGRWFYSAGDADSTPPATFTETHATHLWYHDAVWQTPFVGNMRSVLRAGMMDADGNVAKTDTPVPDNVTIRFSGNALVMHSRGLPNHPTGRFPEPGRGNPSYIQMQDETFYIPLDPKENPKHFTTDATNSNRALNMGPIGVALNGVVFFNPFDMGNTDATDMMDRCCGHPQQFGQYHYHKYPICMNSPWDDQGTGHSGLIGFAFDGYPVYGPYESPGVMAKDAPGDHPLNAFNMHFDPDRGWHYHVTPGKFPYLIGGYWGTVDPRDVRRGPPGGPSGPPPGVPGR